MEPGSPEYANLINALHEWSGLIGISYGSRLPNGLFSPEQHAQLMAMGNAGILNADLSMTAEFRKAMDKAMEESGADDRALLVRSIAVQYRDWHRPTLQAQK